MSNSGGRFYVKQKNVPDGICKKFIHYTREMVPIC